MSALQTFAQALLNGLVDGAAIAVAAVGLTLSYGVSRFINFAYGEYLTYGAFATLALAGVGLPLPVAGLLAVGVVGALGVLVAYAFFRPLRAEGHVPLLITSFGVAFVLRTVLRGAAGTAGRSYQLPLLQPLEFGGLYLSPVNAAIVATAVVVMVGVHALLQHTATGRKLRATSGNQRLARVAGIDVDRMLTVTWFISTGIAALAGVLVSVRLQPFKPTLGWELLLVIFSATILGGIGKPYGAMLGALVIGLTMSLGTTYLSSAYTFGYAFVVLVGVLLVRPEGIMGGEF